MDCPADISERHVLSKRCVECQKEHGKAKDRAKKAAYRAANPEKYRERKRIYRESNRKIRLCEECKSDISDIGTTAKRCVECRERENTEREANRKSHIICKECKADISERPSNAVRCADCQKEQVKTMDRKRNKQPTRKEQKRERAKSRYAANPEKHRSRAKAYRAANHDKKKETDRKYVEKNRSEINARARQRRKDNPERMREKERNYEARNLNQLGKITRGIKKILIIKQDWKCRACHNSITMSDHLDHIIPRGKGGFHDDSNLQILCYQCNASKNDYLPPEYKGLKIAPAQQIFPALTVKTFL